MSADSLSCGLRIMLPFRAVTDLIFGVLVALVTRFHTSFLASRAGKSSEGVKIYAFSGVLTLFSARMEIRLFMRDLDLAATERLLLLFLGLALFGSFVISA